MWLSGSDPILHPADFKASNAPPGLWSRLSSESHLGQSSWTIMSTRFARLEEASRFETDSAARNERGGIDAHRMHNNAYGFGTKRIVISRVGRPVTTNASPRPSSPPEEFTSNLLRIQVRTLIRASVNCGPPCFASDIYASHLPEYRWFLKGISGVADLVIIQILHISKTTGRRDLRPVQVSKNRRQADS